MSQRSPILLFGRSGQVGHYLTTLFSNQNDFVALDRSQVDLENLNAVQKCLRELKPRGIINAAAYTAVEAAESDQERAFLINEKAPGIMAEEAKKVGAWIVHFSTDTVFDGNKTGAYEESDAPRPLSIYAKSKRAGEEAVLRAGGRYVILRTAWIFSLHGKNFLKTILRLAREKPELKIVNDQFGCPTSALWIAIQTKFLIDQFLEQQPADDVWGLYHLVSSGETSWFDFAKKILELDPHRGEQMCKQVLPVGSSEYPSKVIRPKNSVLSTKKWRERFSADVSSWQTQLSEIWASQ